MIVSVGEADYQVPRLDFELSSGCDHRCGHCYNVWNASPGDPQFGYKPGRPLSTQGLKALMEKAVRQSGADYLCLTGGEPLLRADALEIIRHACALVPTVQLITNGSHVPMETARALKAAGLRQVQLTLLAGTRELHDRLKGATCFDDTLRAALNLKEAGVPVQVCFVAMHANAGELAAVMELCCALGVRSLSYNRMSPTGGAVHEVEALMPSVEEIEADLEVMERLGPRFGIRVGTAMPLLPCLFALERYPHIQFGFCSTGTPSPNVVIDPAGNLRSCNLSSKVMGNLVVSDWAELMQNPYPREFRSNVPDICRGCAYEHSCQGGCKESAFAVYGDHRHPEPLLARSMAG
jgi:pyrroloquinoline quinone biosynthesis protein E